MAAIATYTDLETFLGLAAGTINQTRATQMITLAQNLCEAIVDPLPATAISVVLPVAARAYANPTGASQAHLGSAAVSFGGTASGVGGLWLTRAEKANLRRLNGSGTAFSIDTLPTGVSAVQLVTVGGTPTGGTFTLSWVNQVTVPLAYNASAASVQVALEALSALGTGNVTVSGAAGGPYTVTFAGALATTPVPLLGSDATGLTGGTTPTVAVSLVTAGVKKPGQGLPPWGFDYYDSGAPSQYVPGGFL